MKNPLFKNSVSLHTFKNRLMRNPAFCRAYKEGELEYKLIAQRIEKRLTQEELAKRIGTTQSAIARFEAGKVNPRIDFLRKIAKAVGATITVE